MKSATESATSVHTRILRMRESPMPFVLVVLFSREMGPALAASRAGSQPIASIVKSAAKLANNTTRTSIGNVSHEGKFDPYLATNRLIAHEAIITAATAA